jgi:drug/metabolite transporter (DMT)-like permease
VPILGLFFKKKCGINIWLGVLLALIGLYLLCMNGTLKMQNSDILVLICALLFSIHILVVDHFSPLVDGIKMSCIQFFVCGTLGCIPMFFVEMHHSLSGIKNWLSMFTSWDAWIPILYAGVMSCGVAYTLQIIGQKGLNPTVASLLMSLESVFSVIAGWVILNQTMGIRELAGCGLLFSAIILAQLPAKNMHE